MTNFSQQELAMKDVVSPTQVTACAQIALVASFLMLGTINCSSDATSPHDDELGPSSGTGGVVIGAGGTAGVAGGSGGGVPLAGSGGVQPSGGVGGVPVSGGAAGIPVGAGGSAGIGGVGSGGDSGFAGAGATGAGGSTAGPVLPPVTTVDTPGPFMTTIDQNTGPTGTAWVVRPSNLGEGGLLHPIFLWGPGAGTTPSSYQDHLNYWASHGFVVYSIVSTGNGSEVIAGIDWLVAQNTQAGSPYFGMLDTNRIAAGGHSRGSLSAFGAAGDPRLTTTIHVAGGSFDGNGSSNLHAPAAYICGSADTLATPNCERDYNNTTVPVFFTVMQGVDHIMAARSGLPAITAWLRWHLGGEEERRGMFLDPNCTFCTGMWVSQSKNW